MQDTNDVMTHDEAFHDNGVSPDVPQKGQGESFFDFFRFVLLAIVIIVPVRLFIAQPFVVSGASMEPTFSTGNYLIIDEISYRFTDPERGEVIVFRFPFEPDKYLIKRVIGLPSETVELKGEDIIIKNEEHPDGFVLPQGVTKQSGRKSAQTVTLEDDEYFVLGDNRDESADSRLWGPLPREYVVGRPLLRLVPLNKIALFPGDWPTAVAQ
ncbi:MAG: signal peptidase I [bacterium]|nr:signal peptidase I [bacterium]